MLEEEVKDIIDPIIRKKAVYDIKECMVEFQDQISKQKQELVYGKAGQALLEIMDNCLILNLQIYSRVVLYHTLPEPMSDFPTG